MVLVPAGRALIGSDASDDLRNFGDKNLTAQEVPSFCIDKFEFPNQHGKLPRVGAAFAEAEQLCKTQGKRLCAEEEWEKACKGPEQARFPYGANYDAEACNTTDKNEAPRQVTNSGAFDRCKSGYGAYDLSGNVAEWTTGSFEGGIERAVKGGSAARPGFDDRCASRRKAKPGLHDVKIGFRCCVEPA
jgi:formylglycine-generating enzyme required for sulfatase activity